MGAAKASLLSVHLNSGRIADAREGCPERLSGYFGRSVIPSKPALNASWEALSIQRRLSVELVM